MLRAAVLLVFLACACAAPQADLPDGLSYAVPKRAAPVPGTIVETVPAAAVLTHPGGQCLTPCRLDYPAAVQVEIAKAGYRQMRLTVPIGAADAVVTLRPVGRSTAVQEESLPLP